MDHACGVKKVVHTARKIVDWCMIDVSGLPHAFAVWRACCADIYLCMHALFARLHDAVPGPFGWLSHF